VSSFARRNWPVLIPVLVFLLGALAGFNAPGIYLDEVNPDYLVTNLLAKGGHPIPNWIIPGNLLFGYFPLLGAIYHGALPFYVGLPFYALFGTDAFGIRATHAAFAVLIIAAAWGMLDTMGARRGLAVLFLSALAIDPTFQLCFRSAFYITTLPIAFILASVALAWPVYRDGPVSRRRIVASGICAGLSAYGYFIFGFFAALVGLALLAARKRAQFPQWLLGFFIGVLPILLGWLLFALASGGLDAFAQMSSGLGVFRETDGVFGRWTAALEAWHLALNSQGMNRLVLGQEIPYWLGEIKVLGLVSIPLLGLFIGELSGGRSPALRVLTLLAIVPPLIYGLIFGGRLWVQHFTATIPIFYCAAALGLSLLSRRLSSTALLAAAVPVVFVFVNATNFQATILRLNVTGGTGLSSDAINSFSWEARDDAAALYVVPDWGLLFPLGMITRGQLEMTTQFSPELIRSTLCSGRDVVAASLGEGAEQRNAERLGAVDWPGTVSITTTRDGMPSIYAARWTASAKAC